MNKTISSVLSLLLIGLMLLGKYYFIDKPKHDPVANMDTISDKEFQKSLYGDLAKKADEGAEALEKRINQEKNNTQITSTEANTTTKRISFTDDDIFRAVVMGDTHSLSSYLENGLDPNYIDGNTPLLHEAIDCNQIGIIKVLLSNKADVNLLMDDSITPIMAATIKDNKEAVKLLLDAGADPTVKGKYNVTPLEMAYSQGYNDLVPLLSVNP